MFRRLSREPKGGTTYWFMVLAGCSLLLVGIITFASSSKEQGLGWVGLGQAIVGFGIIPGATAELLPKHRIRLATLLRFFGITVLALGAGVLVAALWLV